MLAKLGPESSDFGPNLAISSRLRVKPGRRRPIVLKFDRPTQGIAGTLLPETTCDGLFM